MGYVLEEGPQKATVDHITLDVEGTPVAAYHARPDGEALGGVVLVPDLLGLRPLFEDICRRLATHGLAVCAPETFARLIPPGGSLDVEERRARAGELHDDVVLEDLAKAAATGRFERAVAFYGMVRTPPNWSGGGQRDALDTVGDACPTLALFGEVD